MQRKNKGFARRSKNTHRIIARRRMPAPREIVYRAWTDPERLRQWLCPGDLVAAALDVRVGGSFSIAIKSKHKLYEYTGIYQIVDAPAKLVFTWCSSQNASDVAVVTIEFIPWGEETEVIISHERLTKRKIARPCRREWERLSK